MRLSLSEQDIHAKAVELGLIGPSDAVPPAVRSRVAAVLLREQAPRPAAADVPVAKAIVVRPGGGIEIDGRPFPWVVQADAIEVTVDPTGKGLVRLTIPADSVQIIQSESE
jgi:hypothetical protein